MEKLQPRNLVKLGANSLVITLPKSWLNKNMLKKGDYVYTQEKQNSLVIHTDNKPKEEAKEIIIEYKNKTLKELKSEITTAYISGYDIIRIKKDKFKPLSSRVKFIIHDLVGLEIVQQTSTSVVAKELLDLEKTSIKSITRRIDYLVRGMFDDLILCKKEDDYLNIYDRDFDVNRLSFLVFRSINKALSNPTILNSLKLNSRELMDYRVMVFNLEQIGDNVKRLAKIKCMIKTNKEPVIKLLEFFKKIYYETMDAFYKNDRNKASEIALGNDERVIRCKEFLHNNQNFINAQVVHLLLNLSREVRDISRVLLGMD